MGKKNRRERKGPKRESKHLDERETGDGQLLKFAFAYFSRTQLYPFKYWEENGLLADALDCLVNLANSSVHELKRDQRLKIYGPNIPKGSAFKQPRNIPGTACWASLRLTGKRRLIGFMEQQCFQLVFLDPEHKFYPSPKKHT